MAIEHDRRRVLGRHARALKVYIRHIIEHVYGPKLALAASFYRQRTLDRFFPAWHETARKLSTSRANFRACAVHVLVAVVAARTIRRRTLALHFSQKWRAKVCESRRRRRALAV